MFLSGPLERLHVPVVACWWLGMVVCLHWWAGMSVRTAPPRRHLRLISDHGKLLEQS
jgi:hypothetical protein